MVNGKTKQTIKILTKQFEEFRIAAKDYIYKLSYPTRRALLSVDAADAQGKLNGMTVVELLTIVNLTAATNERVYLEAHDKTITAWAEAKHPPKPSTLY